MITTTSLAVQTAVHAIIDATPYYVSINRNEIN